MVEPVLLTGASGLVGRAVLAELVSLGIPVQAVSRSAHPPMPGVTWHRADLLNSAESRRLARRCSVRALIHCAWDVEHGKFWQSATNRNWRLASLELASNLAIRPDFKIIGIGTCDEYDKRSGSAWDEHRRLDPGSFYAEQKAALHSELARLYPGRVVWARLFHLYGPGENVNRFVPGLLAALGRDDDAVVRSPDLERDYASTGHVARSLVALLRSEASGAFNVASGNCRSLRSLARIVAEAAGRIDRLRFIEGRAAEEPKTMAPDISLLRRVGGVAKEEPEIVLRQHVLLESRRLGGPNERHR